MDTGEGLPDGARVAVIGGGLAAVAAAAALGIAGRVRGRTYAIHVHDPEQPRPHRPPVLLTPACRTDLAALGCRIPGNWPVTRVSSVVAHQEGRSIALPAPPAPLLWLPDAAPLRQSLAASASMHGAVFLGRRVDAVQRIPERSPERGDWVVRAQGRADRYRAVIFATGLGSQVLRRIWRRYRPPPATRVVSLRLSATRANVSSSSHVLLLPAPGLTALELFPEPGGWFAVGWGPRATPAALGEALAHAWDKGLLPEELTPGLPYVGWYPAGAANSRATEGLLAVGDAALGHPLEHGLAAMLAGCSSAAHALVQYGPDSSAMVQAHDVEGQRAAVRRALDAARAGAALHRAGPHALEALAAANATPVPWLSTAPGCFGLLQPPPAEVAHAARGMAFRGRLRKMFFPPVPALPHPPPVAETPHVLLVEADAARAYRIVCALSRRGAQCTVFGDGLETLLEVRRMRPSAVVLGDFLPWLAPETICRSLRAAPDTAALPVIALGDGTRPRQRRALEAAGAHWMDATVPFEQRLAAYLVPVPVSVPPEISGISAS